LQILEQQDINLQ